MQYALFLIAATLATAGEFTTSLGDTYPYAVSAIATDAAGNSYVVGSRALGSVPSLIVGSFASLTNPFASPELLRCLRQ